MKALLQIISIFLFTLACSPRDVAIDGDGSFGGSSANPVVLSKVGQKSPTCRNGKGPLPDKENVYSWTGNDAKIASGDLTAILDAGNRNCYVVGAELPLQNKTNSNPDAPIRGTVKITKVEIVRISDLKESHAQIFNWDIDKLREEANKTVDRLKNVCPKCPKSTFSFVNITQFELVEFTADVGSSGGGGLGGDEAVLEAEGDKAATCRNGKGPLADKENAYIWTGLDAQIASGKITAILDAGSRNCYVVGSEIPIQNKTKNNPDAEIRGQIKVKKVSIVLLDNLNEDHAKSFSWSLDKLKEEAQKSIDNLKERCPKCPASTFEYVSITDFELIEFTADVPAIGDSDGGSNAGGLTNLLIKNIGSRSPTCPSGTKDYKFINVSADKDAMIAAGDITAQMQAGKENCYRVGTVVELKDGLNGSSRMSLKVTKVEVVDASLLSVAQAKAVGLSEPELKSMSEQLLTDSKANCLESDMSCLSNNVLNLTYFEVRGGSTGGSVVTKPVVTPPVIDKGVTLPPPPTFETKEECTTLWLAIAQAKEGVGQNKLIETYSASCAKFNLHR